MKARTVEKERGQMASHIEPAMPLPWHMVWTKKRAWLVSNDCITICGTGDSAKGRELEFAVHAANAYPKLIAALKAAQCNCSVKERDSGHRLDCTRADANELLQELGEL